ncbi:MAG: carbonic anhydrase [Planctomycetota bacterium]
MAPLDSRSFLLALGLLAAAVPATAQKGPDEAKAALVAGNRRFVAGKSVPQPVGPGVRRTLARGQSPYAIVLSCADSRVPPEHVFNAGLGELFVIRVAGNVVDPEALASIEYAAEHLGTQLLVVLGHERCGAVGATAQCVQQAMSGQAVQPESPALAQLVGAIEPAVRRGIAQDLGGRELCDHAEEDHAQSMAVECLRRSTVLQHLHKLGRFQSLPARYRIATGEVEWLPQRPLPPEPQAHGHATPHTTPPSMAPHVALQLLQAGHRRFLSDSRPIADITPARRESLTGGQQPYAIVVTCSDSRVPPEHVFDAGLGELFVIRVAGNVCNDDVLASIEYAAAHTGSPLLLVLGHESCGAVTAAAEHGGDPNLSTNLRALVDRIQPAVAAARHQQGQGHDLIGRAVRANVLRFLQQARRDSAILRGLEQQGRFAMLPAVYDLATGDIEWLKDQGPAAAPHAAPGGETAAPHGGDAHGTGTHGAPTHGTPSKDSNDHGAGGHGAPTHGDDHGQGHGDAHGNDAHPGDPQGHGGELSWADEPLDPHAAAAPATAGHGHGHDADAHGAPGDHDAAHAHAGHGEHGEGAEHGAAPHGGHGTTGGQIDPVTVLGIAGIGSLVAAAAIALRSRA